VQQRRDYGTAKHFRRKLYRERINVASMLLGCAVGAFTVGERPNRAGLALLSLFIVRAAVRETKGKMLAEM